MDCATQVQKTVRLPATPATGRPHPPGRQRPVERLSADSPRLFARGRALGFGQTRSVCLNTRRAPVCGFELYDAARDKEGQSTRQNASRYVARAHGRGFGTRAQQGLRASSYAAACCLLEYHSRNHVPTKKLVAVTSVLLSGTDGEAASQFAAEPKSAPPAAPAGAVVPATAAALVKAPTAPMAPATISTVRAAL